MGIIFGIVVVAIAVGIVIYRKKQKAAAEAAKASRPKRRAPKSTPSTGTSGTDYYSGKR